MEVVATGHWTYDGSTAMPVRIVRLSYDFWHALDEADGTLEPGEQPRLNPEGHAYYYSFRPLVGEDRFWPDSTGFESVAEAKCAAERRAPTTIEWA